MIPSLGHQISNFYVAKYSFSEKLAAVFSSIFLSIERKWQVTLQKMKGR